MVTEAMAEEGSVDEVGDTTQNATSHHCPGMRHSAFREPPPLPVDSTSLWTQFSGMPSHPGSPTSLHQWLSSMDGSGLSSDVFPRASAPPSGAGFIPAAAPKSVHSMHPPSHDPPVDLGRAGQLGGISKQPPNTRHQHDFGPDFDFSHSQRQKFSASPLGDMSHSSPVDFSGLPPADFSRPPPDFMFGDLPDFSRPPPPFMPDVSHPPFSSADQHFSASAGLRDPGCFPPSHLENASRPGETVSPNLFSSHINVSMPPPNYMPFPAFGDDLFSRSADFDPCLQDFEINTDFGGNEGLAKAKKIVRQNSEPVYKPSQAQHTAEPEGKAMYVEALRRLNSFGPSYEPFGSAPDVPAEPTTTTPLVKDTPPVKPSKKEVPKMSYSDAARSLKGKPSQNKTESAGISMKERDKGDAEIQVKKATLNTSSHPFQQHNKHASQSLSSNRKAHPTTSDTGQNFVQPSSKYGLDQFEDVSEFPFGSGEQCSSSTESLNSPQLASAGTRKNSTSSMSSSASAVEEILQSKSGAAASGRPDTGVGKQKPSNLDTRELQVENHIMGTTTTFTAHQAPKATAGAGTQKTKNEKLFFDPKRIFQSKGSSSSSKAPSANDKVKNAAESVTSASQGGSGGGEQADLGREETVLNNGKPNNTSSKATAATHRKADYINNDLRESGAVGGSGASSGSKRTNQTAALNRHSQGIHAKKHTSQKDPCTQNGASDTKLKGADSKSKRQETTTTENAAKEHSFIRNIDWVLVDEWMKFISDCSMTFARNSASATVTILFYLVGIIMYLVMGAIHLIAIGVGKVWAVVKKRLFKGVDQGPGGWGQFSNGSDNGRKRVGLEENIALPATGEEAMKRLLACKGKDPYSILGLRCDTSDEDIKRYYRKQAVLVHPDKNQEPGAEEAFKILGHAFEMIGEPAKRKEYDAHILEASEAEAAMREFSDLLTKLQEKVQEAANMMRCENCGTKHRRIPVDRPWYSARYCERCHAHHSAKEGDVWAESSILGFLWHYYACMDGNIYDITDWVSCQRENFKHMKANAHPVFYRIQTDGNRRHRHGQSGEADLEDFINHLFNKTSMGPDGTPPPGWQFPSQQQGAGSGAQSGWGSSTGASSTKRSRRKKKRN